MPKELIVYVDEQGKPTGETSEKLAGHTADTRLHLAFSCYVFNEEGKLLVTQRALHKKVWPSVWTNSVCGHPGVGESFEDAIARRLSYELGMNAQNLIKVIPDYIYKTPPYNGIVEHEFCPIFVARSTEEPNPNPDEIADYKWLTWDDFVQQASSDGEDIWSWWCKDQIKHLQNNPSIIEYAKPVA